MKLKETELLNWLKEELQVTRERKRYVSPRHWWPKQLLLGEN